VNYPKSSLITFDSITLWLRYNPSVTRWEEGKLSQVEGKTYSVAARPIWNLADDANAIEEVAVRQRIAYMAGMQALGS